MPVIFRVALLALIALPLASATAAPMGYSVNSDAPAGDMLHVIDLETGIADPVAVVSNSQGIDHTDIEGLAFDADGTLWAVDDESQSMFPVSLASAQVQAPERHITGLIATQGHDFGLTFTCSGAMYFTSVEDQSLYLLEPDGAAVLVGQSKGLLGARISALAAYGKPAKLYGLGNGMLSEDGPQDNRSLYRIDMETGVAEPIGEIGNAVLDYFEAGLSFDEDGNLWAITDRRTSQANFGSQILRLSLIDGEATLVSTTVETGFESLAIAGPSGCNLNSEIDNYAEIPVLDRFGLMLAALVLLLTGMSALRRYRGKAG